MIDMLEQEDLSDKSRERLPENYRLRYFTEMEVAGLMGFPKDFSFPPELTTRQVCLFYSTANAWQKFAIFAKHSLEYNFCRGTHRWAIL